MPRTHVQTTINGAPTDFLCDTRQSLLDVLRDELQLTGSKEGCNNGNCGACSVLLDGRVVNSCCVLGVEAAGRDVVTSIQARYDGVDALLADARSRLDRVDVETAYRETIDGALLVDIRPAAQRAEEGEVSPALRPLLVERNVLEWRLDPRSDARLPEASYDARILVLCQEGYTSSLAADALRSLGLDATDVVGGFKAWREAHLPTACPDRVR